MEVDFNAEMLAEVEISVEANTAEARRKPIRICTRVVHTDLEVTGTAGCWSALRPGGTCRGKAKDEGRNKFLQDGLFQW